MKGKHEEFINLGNGSHAFITGVPDDHEHDDKGEIIYFGDGGRFKESELPKDIEEKHKFMDKHRLNGSSVSCSICGKTAFECFDMWAE